MYNNGCQYYVYGDKPPKLTSGGSGDITNINVEKNLSVQIDGIKTTFDVGENFDNLRVYYNSTFQNNNISIIVGTTFTLTFTPRLGSELIVIYDRVI